MRLLAMLVAMLLVPTAAHAEWRQAASTNFIVYADDDEASVRRFAEKLERFHATLELVTGYQVDPPSPSNRVTVYAIGQREVSRLAGGGSAARNIAGFYIPRAGGSVAFVPEVSGRASTSRDFSLTVLLHEYAHHFVISNSTFSQPVWLSEGGAEFFAAAEFKSDGGVAIGMPNVHRYGELVFAQNLTAEQLIDGSVFQSDDAQLKEAYYGKSWLLYHMLTFEPARRGQMRTYVQEMAAGKSSREAGLAAFGDFRALEKDLREYLRRKRLLTMHYSASQLAPGPIAVRALSPGEAAMMDVQLVSRRGVTRQQALELLPRAREIARSWPQDPAVLAALAEAEHDAGNDAEAITAADASIALDPRQVNAYVQKGLSLFRLAETAEDRSRAVRAAVAPFLALNQIENDHPLPLYYNYMSYTLRGVNPPEIAVAGLSRALDLAPFDVGLRMTMAGHQIEAQDLAGLAATLQPLAHSPHGGALAEATRRVLGRLQSEVEDKSAEALRALLRPQQQAADTDAAAAKAGES